MENKNLMDKIIKCSEYINSVSRSGAGHYIVIGSEYQRIIENHKKIVDREEKLRRILGK